MNDGDEITKADLDATVMELKFELTEALAGVREDLTKRFHEMEASLIAAFRSYD